MIGALIGGVASIIGGLISSRSGGKSTTVSKNKVNLKRLVRKSEKAGFNPLTVLRNGGVGAFGSSTSTTTTHPGLSAVGDAIANFGGTLGTAIERANDPLQQKRDLAESALLDYQLRAIQSQQAPKPVFGEVPVVTGATTSKVSPMLSGNKNLIPSSADYVPLNTELTAGKPPTASNLGMGPVVNPGFLPDAEVIENVVGDSEVVMAPYGIAKTLEIGGYSLYRAARNGYDYLTSPTGQTEAQAWNKALMAQPSLSVKVPPSSDVTPRYVGAGLNVYIPNWMVDEGRR